MIDTQRHIGKHHFDVELLVGIDRLLYFVPRRYRLQTIAKKLLKHYGVAKGQTLGEKEFSFSFEGTLYYITDASGAVTSA